MMADTDPLTGLANRRRFAELLERYHSEAIRYGQDLTCCMCDLDHFKRLNDTLGHQLGDKVLVLTAEVIRESIRTSDVAARYGGDEFVILLPHTSIGRGLAVGERIRQEMVAHSRRDNELNRVVTMSVGVASLAADHPSNGEGLVRTADRALYVAKDRGKDRLIAHSHISAPAEQSERTILGED